MRSWLPLAALVVAPLLWSCSAPDRPPVPRADHHLHVRSEASTDALLKIQRTLGQAPPDSIIEQMETQVGAEAIIALLDSARIEKGTLLSMAYFFGMPDVQFADEYAEVRAENDYVADQAAQHPDRLVAFCSVNPLKDYALKEIERCAQQPHLDGLKLQLANSDVNLRDSTHVRTLADVFGDANRLKLPIVIHLWTRHPDYGRTDAEIFIREVLPEAPDVPVQIAHLGGPGMFGDDTRGALQAFAAAIENGAAVMDDDVFFDLGAVTADPDAALARGDTARAKQYRQTSQKVARWVRKIGADRVVFGSDFFARQPADYVETIRSLPLEEKVIRDLFDNTAPYLQ